jgi:large subunit ribosomal protein L31
MREGIHPKYYPEAQVTCSCGNKWTVGATVASIRADVCSACHPFFTGEQRIVDTEGQVERFYQRLERREVIRSQVEADQQAVASGAVSVSELELPSRTVKVLLNDGVSTVGHLMARLEQGDDSLLRIQGFGQKSLIDVRKRLRADGYIE